MAFRPVGSAPQFSTEGASEHYVAVSDPLTSVIILLHAHTSKKPRFVPFIDCC